MSSMKCKVNSSNSSLATKPLIKKIYETHRKWLGGDRNQNNTKKAEVKTTKSYTKNDIVIIHKKTDHSYENVEFKRSLDLPAAKVQNRKHTIADGDEKMKETSENVTVVHIPYNINVSDNRLRIVINNFDKILDEYKPPTPRKPAAPTKIPKLQKAKTCSIIESKCILKKTQSQPGNGKINPNNGKTNERSNLNTTKAKSLHDIAKDSTKLAPLKFEAKKNGVTSSESHRKTLEPDIKLPASVCAKDKEINLTDNKTENKNLNIKIPPPIPSSKPPIHRGISRNPEQSVKVKELVKKLNSLNDSISSTTTNKVEDIQQQEVAKEEIFEGNEVISKHVTPQQKENSLEVVSKKVSESVSKKRLVSASSNDEIKTYIDNNANAQQKTKCGLTKAVSNTDLSATKKVVSKIPVNTNLRKTFPSTPSGLNNLDQQNGCRNNFGENRSKLNSKFTKSVQNLSTSSNKLSLPKHIGKTERNLGKSIENLSGKKNLEVARNTSGATPDAGKKLLGKSMENLNTKCLKPLSLLKQPSFTEKPVKNAQDSKIKRDFVNSNCNMKPQKSTEIKKTGNCVISKITENKKKGDLLTSKENKTVSKPTPAVNLNTKENNVGKVIEKLQSSPRSSEKVDIAKSKQKVDDQAKFQTYIKTVENSKSKTYTKAYKKTEVKKTDTFTKNTNTFGVRKLDCDEKTENKSKINVTSISTDSVQNVENSDEIKLDLKTTQKFMKTIGMTVCQNLYLDPNAFVDLKDAGATKADSSNDLSSKLDRELSKLETKKSDKLNYNSDDGSEKSDDSGNISTEIEVDDQFSCSSTIRSRSSTDSLLSDYRSDRPASQNGVISRQQTKSPANTKEPKIFFRNGVLSQLESQRDERLAGMVVNLQAHCRGYLARKKLTQRKLQDLAVRCIQRNVRKFLLVRDWPWWRLLVRVTPLLNVHRTEEELRIKTDELEALKTKLEKLENERTTLKHDKDKLEAKLSELTADLAEEHSTSTLAAERLDAETSERMKLERELNDVQHKNKQLQQCSERLEMELLYAKSELNGIMEEQEGEGDGDDGGVYKQRYERAVRELEFTKRRLQQQHEDDLEQLVGLKKQLEKKLTDAYEEVEEQRQVVGQWKRKVQKLNGEMNDLKLLLEEQNARNNLLEKKQRKFDSETQMLQDELKKERQAKDRLSREKEVMLAEKYSMDSNIADIRLELELKEEKLLAMQREFDEITCGGKTEEEVTVLRRQKIECERRLQDQEEELDELAGQVQLLEQAKLRLEMTLESMRKEAKKETQMRDEELEEVRCNAQKKVKALEQQLENEHEERTLLLRERHELERRLAAAAETERNDRAGDEALLQRLKRDLKRTKALLRDTQAQLERQKAEAPGKNVIRQLRNQLEDLECARSIAIKAKQTLETELSETQASLEEANRQKNESEDRANTLLRERNDLQAQLEENEEELAEVLKKYKAAVQQTSLDQMALQEQVSLVSELEVERNQLRDQLNELSQKLEAVESMGDASSNLLVKRNEMKIKELESKLELEHTTKARLDVQIARLKETVDKLQTEVSQTRVKEQQAQDQIRKLQRTLREVKEELNKSLIKESEALQKKKEMDKRCEGLEQEAVTARTDLRLALKRIEDLQSAIQGELEDTPSDNSDSDQDTYSSDESVNTFLANHTTSSRGDKSPDSRRLSSNTTSRSSTSNSIANHSSSYA